MGTIIKLQKMFLPKKEDAVHRAWLYRTLAEIYSDAYLSKTLAFKGGTCATMRGFLDRFSVDLDFDLISDKNEIPQIRKKLEKIFEKLGLEIKDSSHKVPQYFLRYPAKEDFRNTLKIDVTTDPPKSNRYEMARLSDIDKIVKCQTIETMFANKLVALIDRYEKNESIAGRDVYDIHYFFLSGYDYDKKIIEERRKISILEFFNQLIEFVEKNITLTIIQQDLNILLSYEKFRQTKWHLKNEVVMFLKEEFEKMKSDLGGK
jgi:predicted nucleotidyltransferase component of viral defense system